MRSGFRAEAQTEAVMPVNRQGIPHEENCFQLPAYDTADAICVYSVVRVVGSARICSRIDVAMGTVSTSPARRRRQALQVRQRLELGGRIGDVFQAVSEARGCPEEALLRAA